MKSIEQIFKKEYELVILQENVAQLLEKINKKRNATICGLIIVFGSISIALIISNTDWFFLPLLTLIWGLVLYFKGFNDSLIAALESKQIKIKETKIKILRIKYENDLVNSKI